MSKPTHDADVAFIRALAELLRSNDLSELQVKREYGEGDSLNVRVSRVSSVTATVAVPAATPAAPAEPCSARRRPGRPGRPRRPSGRGDIPDGGHRLSLPRAGRRALRQGR